MPLAPGTSLGPYRIESLLGAGGMGEVYRARDAKLHRDVAIKVLPAAFAADPERLAPFEREAQLLASLNHPHIAQIYGVEERALVMELVDGDTLADRIARGPMPLDDVVSIARQIADALEAAHERGVVHRDLKPANIKITSEGAVKVLDFGLAKALGSLGAAADDSPSVMNSPTLTSPATQLGVILGTAAYMAPEQARGRALDKRADIWAFGCIAYEMLAGSRPFTGDSTTELLSAVTRDEPDWQGLPSSTPEKLRHLIARCLTKNPKRRLRDIGEARIILDEPLGPASPPMGQPVAATRTWRSLLRWAGAIALAVAAGAAAVWLLRSGTPAERVVRASIAAPSGQRFYLPAGNPGPVVLSPDGSKMAFVASDGAQARLWVRDLDAIEPHVLAGTEGPQYPFWSADSRAIGFFAGNKLRKVDLTGGLPVALADAPDGKGGAWNADGVILFTPDSNQPIHRVSASGGAATRLTTISREAGENSHRFPQFLPDGRHFLFIARGDTTGGSSARRAGSLRIGSLDSGASREITAAESQGVYASGHILYVQPQTTTLVARPFDPHSLNWSGDPVPVVEHVLLLQGSMAGVFSASQNGVLVYMTASQASSMRLAWVDRSGKILNVVRELGDYGFDLSTDGRRIVMEDIGVGGAEDLWMVDAGRGTRTRLTSAIGGDVKPIFAPDGQSIVFSSDRKGLRSLYWKSVTGGADEVQLLSMPFRTTASSWSPDGRLIAFYSEDLGESSGIWLLPVDASQPPKAGAPERVIHSRTFDFAPRFSPDGRWLAFTSRSAGTDDVYVTRVRGDGRKWQVSTSGGAMPKWRRDGKELYYLTPDGQVTAVAVGLKEQEIEVGTPSVLFPTFRPLADDSAFDANADGTRLLVLNADERSGNSLLTLVAGWTSDLHRAPR